MNTKFLTAYEARQRASEYQQAEQAYIVINQAVDRGEYWTTLYKMPTSLRERLVKGNYKIREEKYTPVSPGFGFDDDKEIDQETRYIVSW